MSHYDAENPWGMDITRVDADDFTDVVTPPKTLDEEMAFAAEIPLLDELAEKGTPTLTAEVIALNSAKLLAQERQAHAA